MAYGFNDDKSKVEVATAEELETVVETEIHSIGNNFIKLTSPFLVADDGECYYLRLGRLLFVYGHFTFNQKIAASGKAFFMLPENLENYDTVNGGTPIGRMRITTAQSSFVTNATVITSNKAIKFTPETNKETLVGYKANFSAIALVQEA